MYENCHISASLAPRHFKIDGERAYTIIYHKMNLFLSRRNYVGNIIWLEIVKKLYNELCDNIYRSALPYKTNSLNITFQHMLRHGFLYFLIKQFLSFDILS